MNTKLIWTTSAVLATLLALPFGQTASASEFFAAQSRGGNTSAQLDVRVIGLKEQTGQLRVGLYDTAAGFEEERDIKGKTVPVSSSSETVTFSNLPVGDYAVKVFHDIDGDGELDTNALGIPSEPYGFSNNASDPFSAPEWEETQFSLPRGRMTHTIDLD